MSCEICSRDNCAKYFHSEEEQAQYDKYEQVFERKYDKIISKKDVEIEALKDEIQELTKELEAIRNEE